MDIISNQSVRASNSRHITYPLRAAFYVRSRAKAMFSSTLHTVKRNIGDLPSPILITLTHFARAHPLLKAWAIALVCRSPMLEAWLYRFVLTRGLIAGRITVQVSDPSRLTPSARRIYTDLKAAIELHYKGG